MQTELLHKLPARLETDGHAAPRKRLLFVGEAVSLAHVGRPLQLARWAREAGYEVHFACGPAYAEVARAEGFEPYIVTTIVPSLFYKRLRQGKFFYSSGELETYVKVEGELFSSLKPDLVVGDFRLSLDISTTLAGIPLLSLNNAHWSPAAVCRFPAPRNGLLGWLPAGLRDGLFDWLRPLAFGHFAAPLNRVRRRFGLPALSDFRELYTAGNWCAYLDLPEFMPLAAPLPAGHFYLGPVAWAPQETPPPTPPLRGEGRTAPITTETQRHGEKPFQCIGNRPFSVSPCPLGLSSGRRLRGEQSRTRPLVYVSLGGSGEQHVLPEVLRALVAQGCDVVLSGVDESEEAKLREEVPGWDDRVRAGRLLDPRSVLARAALCVCHGGSGTVYQSLAHGVPLVCLPGNPDQGLVSQAVEAAGAGLALAQGRTRGVRLALEEARHKPSYRLSAQRLAKALARHDTRGRWLRFLARISHGSRSKSALQASTPAPFSAFAQG